MDYLNLRINKHGIKQYHVSERELDEGTLKKLPNKYWVNWFEVHRYSSSDSYTHSLFLDEIKEIMISQVKEKTK